ncbi:NADPH oxidase activator 1 isoform X2 [Brienomyrus brachyistius]|uniref:NADPH oxidase activator 1 isoform X2 n=1 Tax=Brienomyrus brachyistius TaxID=42636 RepID=UPI0020B19EB9|nr:NADPH oxidase activator 1 isoform X2 [Brienomyrus brachyistius]
MLYTELLQLWDQAVQAVDGRDWQGALTKLQEITEPTSRTLFVTAAAHLALGQLEPAIRTLDQVIAKDERLAVGFFQRAGVHMLAGRLEEALGDCIWAQKHMRENSVIDYRQLGLRYKLYSWQVLYNAAAVYSRMGLWEKGRNILATASQEKGGARGGIVEMALDSLSRKDILSPLLVPEGEVFRPRKQDVEQLQLRDFLGKAKVISSVIPNDDFGGFEPLRMQQPGFYEPQADGAQESRYMRLRSAHTAQGPQQLTVGEGEVVFVFSNDRADGLATVIYDGQKGLLPFSLLDPLDVYKIKDQKKGKIPNGIPLPPGLKPPARPLPQPSPASAQSVTLPAASDPSCTSSTFSFVTPPEYPSAAGSGAELQPSPAPEGEGGSVIVKVHYTCTVALSVPVETPYGELRERIAHKLGRPPERLCLRYKQQGSPALKALEEQGGLCPLLEGSETGRVTLWCQSEDPLSNRNILYQVVALYDYTAQGPEDLEFSEGDTIDILSEVNDEWLEGHTAGNIGIFPRCFVYQDTLKSDDSA